MKILKIFLITLLSLIVILLLYYTIRYSLWKRDFFTNNQNLVCTNEAEYQNEIKEINLLDRIKSFVFSKEKSEFVSFTQREMLHILKDSIQSTGLLNIQDVCLLSSKGVWRIYAHSKLSGLQLPWIGVDIIKDNRESTEIYSKNMYVGDIKLPSALARDFVASINKGISDALIQVLENNFLGKTIMNIDLLDDSVVIKGIR